MTGKYVKTFAIDVNPSRTPEDGADSLRWPNGLIIVLIKIRHHVVRLSLITGHSKKRSASD
jgi:hypothetical protein